jgi:hypothetical protein
VSIIPEYSILLPVSIIPEYSILLPVSIIPEYSILLPVSIVIPEYSILLPVSIVIPEYSILLPVSIVPGKNASPVSVTLRKHAVQASMTPTGFVIILGSYWSTRTDLAVIGGGNACFSDVIGSDIASFDRVILHRRVTRIIE